MWVSGDDQYDAQLKSAVEGIQPPLTEHERGNVMRTAVLQHTAHSAAKGLQIAPSQGKDGRPARPLPDRLVVSVSIYNGGAADEGKFFPNAKDGTKISDRWATLTFRTKDDVDDVEELYGGKLALNQPALFEQNLVHLYPLYRESHEEVRDPSYQAQGSEMIKETGEVDHKTGERIRVKWNKVGDEDYQPECNNEGKPHYLYVTTSDPNESLLSMVLDEAVLKGQEAISLKNPRSPDDPPFPDSQREVIECWQEENKQWALVQEWLMSSEKYGAKSSSKGKDSSDGQGLEFRNFNSWMQAKYKKEKDEGRK